MPEVVGGQRVAGKPRIVGREILAPQDPVYVREVDQGLRLAASDIWYVGPEVEREGEGAAEEALHENQIAPAVANEACDLRARLPGQRPRHRRHGGQDQHDGPSRVGDDVGRGAYPEEVAH